MGLSRSLRTKQTEDGSLNLKTPPKIIFLSALPANFKSLLPYDSQKQCIFETAANECFVKHAVNNCICCSFATKIIFGISHTTIEHFLLLTAFIKGVHLIAEVSEQVWNSTIWSKFPHLQEIKPAVLVMAQANSLLQTFTKHSKTLGQVSTRPDLREQNIANLRVV